MGNCIKRNRSDTHSLLREESESYEPSNRDLPPPYQEESAAPIFNLTPSIPSSSSASSSTNLSEAQQIRLAQRLGLIQHLPSGVYDGSKKKRECVICMCDFSLGDEVRFLPCMHIYHKDCIDDWLMRSFTCPSCVEPVDAALLSTYFTNEED